MDKAVLQLLRDRTEGNTVVKVWRQVQENHCEEFLKRKDLYTTLLSTLTKPGGIVSAFQHKFKAPPKRRELPSPRLLRHAFLLYEADRVQDYRTQILSTFGSVLKMDSTKKVRINFVNVLITQCQRNVTTNAQYLLYFSFT